MLRVPLPGLQERMRESWSKLQPFVGPAFLVAAGYMDPGNWATAIEGGARFGYNLVWVITLSHLVAVLFQTLSAKLGLATGKHLAQACRAEYPRPVCLLLWILCEISMVALDLTMLLGSAIGLNLLFRIPVFTGLILASMDAFINILVVPRLGVRRTELLAVGIIGVIVSCFVVDILVTRPSVQHVVGGMWPNLSKESLYTAVSLLGANVMPHNFFLHSALVIQQPQLLERKLGNLGATSTPKYRFLKILYDYNFVDISCALGAALFVNIAVLLVAAATFHANGNVVTTLQGAHDVMEQLLSSNVAPAAFGLALLCAGQLSSFTGTIAGQFVLEGFLNFEMKPWLRRLITRLLALAPAIFMLHRFGNEGIYKILLHAQVVLAMELPFVIVPLIKVTSSADRMGMLKINAMAQFMAWTCTVLVFGANVALLFKFYWESIDTATGTVWWWISGKASDQLLDSMAAGKNPFEILVDMTISHPITLCIALAELTCISVALGVLLWMIVTPLPPMEKGSAISGVVQDRSLSPTTHALSSSIDGKKVPASSKGDQVGSEFVQGHVPDWDKNVRETCYRRHKAHEETPHDSEGNAEGGKCKTHHSTCHPSNARFTCIEEGSVPAMNEQKHPYYVARAGNELEQKQHVLLQTFDQLPRGFSLSKGSRKSLATKLDSFWSNIFDLHGRSRGRKQKGALNALKLSDQVELQLLATLDEIAHIPGIECLCIVTCSSTSDLRQDEDKIGAILISLGSLPTGCNSTRDFNCAAEHGFFSPTDSDVILSFGSWCIIRLLELCAREPRPELWGKYCYVLNRLQGTLLDCVTGRNNAAKNTEEVSVRCQAVISVVHEARGPSGTGAGEIAFPKGREITLSVVNRYLHTLTQHVS